MRKPNWQLVLIVIPLTSGCEDNPPPTLPPATPDANTRPRRTLDIARNLVSSNLHAFLMRVASMAIFIRTTLAVFLAAADSAGKQPSHAATQTPNTKASYVMTSVHQE